MVYGHSFGSKKKELSEEAIAEDGHRDTLTKE